MIVFNLNVIPRANNKIIMVNEIIIKIVIVTDETIQGTDIKTIVTIEDNNVRTRKKGIRNLTCINILHITHISHLLFMLQFKFGSDTLCLSTKTRNILEWHLNSEFYLLEYILCWGRS